jgi:hypothetical protein
MSSNISESQQRANKTKAEKILRYDAPRLRVYLDKKERREADLLAQLQKIQRKIKVGRDRLTAVMSNEAKEAP